jgi:hypothetical protein
MMNRLLDSYWPEIIDGTCIDRILDTADVLAEAAEMRAERERDSGPVFDETAGGLFGSGLASLDRELDRIEDKLGGGAISDQNFGPFYKPGEIPF